jgi:UDP-glucose 4-epimerase
VGFGQNDCDVYVSGAAVGMASVPLSSLHCVTMRILVTGSAGHLGEALMETLRHDGRDAYGVDIQPSRLTDAVGSITDRTFVRSSMDGVSAVIHAATLHKPHVGTHSRQAFVDTNITGTLTLLEEAVRARVGCFVFTSTTSAFGAALTPAPGEPAVWVTEDVTPVPKNIYGVTKVAAENLCELYHRTHGLPCLVLRTSRFFPEEDDDAAIRDAYADDNVKANELLYRRVDIEDVVRAHLLALEHAASIGFGRYIISATTPFSPSDLPELRAGAPGVVARLFPEYEAVYARRGWRMFPSIDRVYVNARARDALGWRPQYEFGSVLARLRDGGALRSSLARLIGAKGYHGDAFAGGRYFIAASAPSAQRRDLGP